MAAPARGMHDGRTATAHVNGEMVTQPRPEWGGLTDSMAFNSRDPLLAPPRGRSPRHPNGQANGSGGSNGNGRDYPHGLPSIPSGAVALGATAGGLHLRGGSSGGLERQGQGDTAAGEPGITGRVGSGGMLPLHHGGSSGGGFSGQRSGSFTSSAQELAAGRVGSGTVGFVPGGGPGESPGALVRGLSEVSRVSGASGPQHGGGSGDLAGPLDAELPFTRGMSLHHGNAHRIDASLWQARAHLPHHCNHHSNEVSTRVLGSAFYYAQYRLRSNVILHYIPSCPCAI